MVIFQLSFSLKISFVFCLLSHFNEVEYWNPSHRYVCHTSMFHTVSPKVFDGFLWIFPRWFVDDDRHVRFLNNPTMYSWQPICVFNPLWLPKNLMNCYEVFAQWLNIGDEMLVIFTLLKLHNVILAVIFCV